MRQYRITIEERDRWSSPDKWFEYFDTREEAQSRIDDIRKKYGGKSVVPDYYWIAYDLVLVDRVEETKTVDKIIEEK